MNVTPPPVPNSAISPATLIIEYPGNWVLFESFMSKLSLTVNGEDCGPIPFKKPKTITLQIQGPVANLHASLAKIRTADLSLPLQPGKCYRVLLDYNRAWGNISFKLIQ